MKKKSEILGGPAEGGPVEGGPAEGRSRGGRSAQPKHTQQHTNTQQHTHSNTHTHQHTHTHRCRFLSRIPSFLLSRCRFFCPEFRFLLCPNVVFFVPRVCFFCPVCRFFFFYYFVPNVCFFVPFAFFFVPTAVWLFCPVCVFFCPATDFVDLCIVIWMCGSKPHWPGVGCTCEKMEWSQPAATSHFFLRTANCVRHNIL